MCWTKAEYNDFLQTTGDDNRNYKNMPFHLHNLIKSKNSGQNIIIGRQKVAMVNNDQHSAVPNMWGTLTNFCIFIKKY